MSHDQENKINCYLVDTGYWINKKKKQFTRGNYIPYRVINSFIEERNNTGIFCTAYRYDNSFKYMLGNLYFDFDSKNFDEARKDALMTIAYLETILFIKKEYCNIYFSGKKGIHITVPYKLFGIKPNKELNIIYKYIATNIKSYIKSSTLDLIYDNKRLFRIPNSIHEDTGFHKIILTYDELYGLSSDEIKNIAKTTRPIRKKHVYVDERSISMFNGVLDNYSSIKETKVHDSEFKINFVPSCIKKILEEGAVPGNRNNLTAILASFYKNRGLNLDNTEDKISSWNDESSNPLSLQEIKNTIESVYKGNYNYGCSTIKEYVECNPNCRFAKNAKQKNN